MVQVKLAWRGRSGSVRTKKAFEGYFTGAVQVESFGNQGSQPLFPEQFWILIKGPKDLLQSDALYAVHGWDVFKLPENK